MSCPNIKHPLIHNGTSQNDRLAPELLQLDDRSTKAFLHFAYEFGALLKYYNLQDQEEGNWQCFFSGGALGFLSIITAIDLAALDDDYCRKEYTFWEELKAAEEKERETVRRAQHQILIDSIHKLAEKIDSICKGLSVNPIFQEEVRGIIKQDLINAIFDNKIQNVLKKLISYDKGNQVDNGKNELIDVEKYKAFIQSDNNRFTCTKIWEIDNIDEFVCIRPDDGFSEAPDPNTCKENRQLRNLFFIFYQTLARIVERAKFYLQKELDENSAQEPQVSLFLAFIFLFKRLLGELNKLTQKHLDFYYQQVLCLPFQPFTPDQVFVVFELAKGIQTFRLQEGTVLDAQKDQEGNKRQYKLDSKLVVNRAKVESCSALYAEKTNNQFYVQTKSSTDNDLRWRNFPKNQEGEVGIAVSDPILKLGEGTRFIVMTIDVKKKLKADLDLNPHTKVRLSSAESPDGWVKMASVGEGNTGNLEYLGVPHPTSGKGLTDNITGKRNIKNTNYSNFSTSTSLVRVINNNQIEVRVLVKKDSFSISIPESDIGDPIFRRLEYPMLKVTFSNQIGELLNDVNINKIRIVTESVGVKKGVQIRNQLGTFNNQDTVSLLGNPAASSSNETKAGAFVEFEVEEMKGKQLLGLAPEPNFLRPLNNNKGFPINKNEFEPRFRVIDDFRGYKVYKKGEEAKNEDNKEVPQLAGDYNNFKVSYDRTNELPTTSGKRGKQTPKESSSQGEFIFDPNVSALGSTMVKIPGVNNDLIYLEETTVLDRFVLPNTVSNPYGSSIYGVKIPFNSKVDSIAELKTFNKKRNKKNNNPESSTLKYSTLRNQNVLQLRYKEEVRAVKKGKPELKSDPAQVKGVSFRYSAQAILVNNNRIKQEFDCYHITPQGYNRINTTEFVGGKSLLPEYHLLSTDGNKTATTYLHIGIKELQPGQLLSLLFVTEEGTGNANFDPPAIQWQYLTKDEDGISDLWEDFPEGSIFSDATKFDQQSKASLLQSGIIQFTTSSLMTNRGTTIQPEKGLYWIRATFTENDEDENIAALPNILKIYAQAAVATFNNQDNELSHLKQGIEPNTISKLVNQVQTIKSVTQPLSSFDGRPEEDQQAYYRRVSERLRHKNRAVNIWDYERLILEAFPEVFHAKTLSHTSKSCNIAPGKVMVAVFPDLRNRADVNPFTPGFAIGKLERIEDYLRERANLFLFCEESIQVVNPIYELVKVKCCVRFRPGFSPAFYKTQLNTDLHGFLAPWTLNFETAELMFSGELHTSTILHFIEERPYVDVVSNFEVYHYTIDLQTGEPKNPPTLTTTELIRTKTARSILTTYADGHEITLWGDSGCDDCKTPEFTDFNICNS